MKAQFRTSVVFGMAALVLTGVSGCMGVAEEGLLDGVSSEAPLLGADPGGYFPTLPASPSLNPMLMQGGTAPAEAPAVTPEAASTTAATPWLRTSGNKIVLEDGSRWKGRGANLHDTRSCNACTWGPPNVEEVKRRVDELVDVWNGNFIRLALESYGNAGVLNDAKYLEDVKEIVAHIGKKKGVYVLLSLWIDPTFNSMGWPTAQTHPVWVKLAQEFKDDPHVMYGLVNEPQNNFDGALDGQVWSAMNQAVEVIRNAEKTVGARPHIIAVQGTGGWARRLDYYVTHPIAAGGGQNVAYEVHVYDSARDFQKMFEAPSQTLPVIIGEFGPMHSMTLDDCSTLMERAEALGIPYLAWTFHMRCPPNLIVDNSNNGCGINMKLEPTPWGRLLKDRLARSYYRHGALCFRTGGVHLSEMPADRAIHRGDLFWVAPDEARGSVPGVPHPHLVLQEDVFNQSRIHTVVMCATTSNLKRANEPGNVLLEPGEGNLARQSVLVVSQVSAVEKTKLGAHIGTLSERRVQQVLEGMRFQQTLLAARASERG